MALKVIADLEICEGYGRCVLAAPELFTLNEDGDKVVVRQDTVTGDDLETKARNAIGQCPISTLRGEPL